MDSRAPHAAPLKIEGKTLAMSEGSANMPPLTERDRTNRSSTSSNRPLTGNSDSAPAAASPRQIGLRTTPPSGRLLASTQASAAKATPPSLRYRKPLPSTRPSSISRLPRRDASAPVAPTPVPKWAVRVAQREADAEASNQRTTSPSVTSGSQRNVDKPLPPRPVASRVSTASPVNDGRTLIDASDYSKRLSVGDGWPTLTPRSINGPERHSRSLSTDTKTIPSGIPRRTSGNNLTVAAVSELAGSAHERDVSHSRTSGLTGRSSIPSFVSAEESVGGGAHSESASVVDASPRNDTSRRDQDSPPSRSNPGFPPRGDSLATRSNYSDLATESGGTLDVSAISDNTKESYAPAHEGRKPNASPTNFSRLRGAMQPRQTSLSSVRTPGTDQIASRIPIPGSKKATLVPLKTQNLGSDPDENSPTFGTRRLVSPNALAILDQGTKRRLGDLQRANTNNSDASDHSQLMGRSVRELRTRNYSTSSSPADTTGVSDSDSDLHTPVSQSSLPRSGTMVKLTPGDPATDRYEPAGWSTPPDVPRLRRVPPSNSRLTRPLETIPSQSMLIDDQPELGIAVESKFTKVAKKLSQAQTKMHPRQDDNLRDANRDELREILTAAQVEDDARQKDGVPGFDIETKNHLTRTLSQLEGKGTPPNQFVDYDKLQAMFGNMASRSSTTPNTNTFIDNAFAANRFLERGSVSSEQVGLGDLEDRNRLSVEPRRQSLAAAGTTSSTPVISKWSDSTPSAIGESTELPRSKIPTSIGFPSATPSATRIPSFTADSLFAAEEAIEPAAPTRNSSSTLSPGKIHQEKSLGSVRRARENMSERGDFARMTRASLSKKTARTPTSASKGFRKYRGSARSARGRDSIPASVAMSPRGNLDERAGRTKTISSTTEPRSHSKGRNMLNKMAGLFSKREKDKTPQQIPVPPLPPLDLDRRTGHTTLDVMIDKSNPFRSSPTPSLPAVPALRQSPFEEPRPSSPASNEDLTSVLDEENDQAITSVVSLTEKMLNKARRPQTSLQDKSRMLNFAKILNEGLMSAGEAKISAERARQLAEAAELSYRKTKRAVQMLERLASSLVQNTVRR